MRRADACAAPVTARPHPARTGRRGRAPRRAGSDLLGGPGAARWCRARSSIGPDTSYVNVTGGEVIRFEVGGKSFVWNFIGTRSSFDLARVAPPGLLDRKVTAYVAPNPMYPKK